MAGIPRAALPRDCTTIGQVLPLVWPWYNKGGAVEMANLGRNNPTFCGTTPTKWHQTHKRVSYAKRLRCPQRCPDACPPLGLARPCQAHTPFPQGGVRMAALPKCCCCGRPSGVLRGCAACGKPVHSQCGLPTDDNPDKPGAPVCHRCIHGDPEHGKVRVALYWAKVRRQAVPTPAPGFFEAAAA